MEMKVQSQSLDHDKIYWDDKSEIYVHDSGMCYDPNPSVKAYYTLVDQDGSNLRTLYYI